MAGKFLSLDEAARHLGVSVDEVNRLVDRKKLFPMRDGATLKFKADEIDRVALSLGDDSSYSDGLTLDFDQPEAAPAAGSLSGIEPDDIVLGDAIDAGESIFSADASEVKAASHTMVRGEAVAGGSEIAAGNPSDLSMPSLGGASAASAADIVFGDAAEGEDLALESIIGASSPSLAMGGPAAPKAAGTDDDGTLAIDLSGVGIGDVGGSLAFGSDAGLAGSPEATGAGLSLSGALDSGLSLEDGDIQMSGVDLGADAGMSAAPEDGTVLGGDDFELGSTGGDDDSASVVIASESGDSSFFGETMEGQGSAFADDAGLPSSIASEALEISPDFGSEMGFSVWQTVGLICCSLLLLFGGFIAYDLVRTIGSPESTTLSNPLLNAMADAFGWR